MAKALNLSNGGATLVDDADFKWLSQWKWTRDGYGYALRFYGSRENQKQIRLHRAIMGARPHQLVDHINMDTLDNRRSNLRLCTRSQNMMNKGVRQDSATGLKGVTRHKSTGLWMARIKKDGKLLVCTYHKSPKEAARAYDEAAIKYHGSFARTNG